MVLRRPAIRALLALAAVALCCTLAAAPARAERGAAAQARWPADGAAVAAALQLAGGYWAAAPCGGEVLVDWEAIAPRLNAEATWASASDDPFADPAHNTSCEIDLST